MRFYLRFLGLCYGVGAALHIADLFGARLRFSDMSPVFKAWIVYLTLFDLGAAVGLWRRAGWGVALFVFIATSQLVVYGFFRSVFGPQDFLIGFHIVTLAGYAGLAWLDRRRRTHRSGT